jgi:hypothetical protein
MRHLKSWIFLIVLSLGAIIIHQHKFDDPWSRPINGDGKGYYAFLPAIFIYQDLSYSFVDSMEMKYYPSDGSLAKHFRVEQPNGSIVNKCFPGTAIFYLPFFLIAAIFSWLLGFPLDGYSQLFQWSVAFAHLFYLFWGLHLLNAAMKVLEIELKNRVFCVLMLVFATNLFFYLVYDFTLPHVFGMIGTCALLYLISGYKHTGNIKYFYFTIPLLALLILTRPTNAMLLISFPLLLKVSEIKMLLRIKREHFYFTFLAIAILGIAPLLWKLQSGNWLVYSYGEERMDLLNPHFFEFLFSYQKGWWLWTPFLFYAFILGSYYFWKESILKGITFIFGILAAVYVFSSWWIWTFGTGFGQRPLIEFYPVLLLGFAGFLQTTKWKWIAYLAVMFVPLNLIQAYQIRNFVMHGGTTTKEEYWNHFLQLKVDPPVAEIKENWQEIARVKLVQKEILNINNPFSNSIVLENVQKNDPIVVKCIVGGVRNETKATIVLNSDDGLYIAKYIQSDLYEKPRLLSYTLIIDSEIETPLKCYVWNNDIENEVIIEQFEVIHYREQK